MSGRDVLRGVFWTGCLLWSVALAISGFGACVAAMTLIYAVAGGVL